jgi:hypothetical protein
MIPIPKRYLHLVRGFLLFLAGVFFGTGLLLFGQVKTANYMRNEVSSTFFVFRQIGYATFFLQPNENQVALALSEMPESYLVHSKRVAFSLMVFSGLILAFVPFCRDKRKRKKG